MINDIVIDIERVGDQIAFVFADGPVSFLSFVVTENDTGEQLWELCPIGMGGDATSSGGKFAAIEATSPDTSADFWNVVNSLRSDDRLPALPTCEKVQYGVSPEGYKEIAPARPLQRGKSYCVTVLHSRATGD